MLGPPTLPNLDEDKGRLAAIVESTEDAIISKDLNGTILTWNRGAERLFGYTAGQAIGRPIYIIIPADLHDQEDMILAQVKQGHTLQQFETIRRRQNGDLIDVSLTISPIRDSNGAIIAACKIARDISARKRAEEAETWALEALRLEQERLCRALQAGRMGAYEWNPVHRIVWWSPEMYSIFGVDHRFDPLDAEQLIHPDDRQAVSDGMSQAIAQQKTWFQEYRIVRPDGEVRWVAARAEAKFGDSIGPRFCGIVTDITDRKRAAEQLRLRTARFEALLNAAPVGLYLVDGNFRIRHVNPVARPVFGEIPDLIGRDFAEVIHTLWPKVYAEEVIERFRHTLETGEPYIVPERIEERRDRGVREIYEWQIHRIPSPEGGYGVVCYFRDISDQVKTRETLRASEKLAAAGHMASSIAHEINNPLNAVVNLLYLLGDEPISPSGRKYLEAANAELRRVVHISKQALSFYRHTNLEPVNICEMLGQLIESMRINPRYRDIDFRFRCAQCVVQGRREELEQLFANLFTNAAEADSRVITVRISPGQSPIDPARRGVRVTIVDDGKGIPRRDREHLFDAFYTTKEDKGTGLGLWICKLIAMKYEGRIAMRSRTEGDRRGTVFSVFLSTVALQAVSAKPSEPYSPLRTLSRRA